MLEYILRWVLLLPLALITSQVLRLNRKFLHSKSWNLLAGGFLVFLIRNVLVNLSWMANGGVVGVIVGLLGFGLVAFGFQVLIEDLKSLKKIHK